MASNEPRWGDALSAVGPVLTAAGALGAAVVWVRGAFRDKTKDSTDRAASTLDGVFRFVNELQEERTAHLAEISTKDTRIRELEQEVRELRQGGR